MRSFIAHGWESDPAKVPQHPTPFEATMISSCPPASNVTKPNATITSSPSVASAVPYLADDHAKSTFK